MGGRMKLGFYSMTILTCLCCSLAVPRCDAAIIQYDFNDGNGIVDVNNFGGGLVAGSYLLTSAGGTAFQNNRAETAVRNNAENQFSVTIPNGTMVELTTLSFDFGFRENSHPNDLTPEWTLTITPIGIGTPSNGALPTLLATGHVQEYVEIALGNLEGVTNTTLTFTLDLATSEGRNNSLSRAHTIDNVTLTGQVIPEPGTYVSFGIVILMLLPAYKRFRLA